MSFVCGMTLSVNRAAGGLHDGRSRRAFAAATDVIYGRVFCV
jgi:hypothetical protein